MAQSTAVSEEPSLTNHSDSVDQTDDSPTTIYIEQQLQIYERPSIWRQIRAFRNILVVILAPILLLPLVIIGDDKKTQCAYVIVLMGVFWMGEVVPIAATSLIPFFLFPMTGVLTAKAASATYMNDTSMLFFGGLTVAVAIETWNLHKRIALKVMMLVGAEPMWLTAGLMSVTWFLSMWISNTATTGMMLPIVHGILLQLKEASDHDTKDRRAEQTGETNEGIELEESNTDGEKLESGNVDSFSNNITSTVTSSTNSKEYSKHSKHEAEFNKRIEKALSLCICYSANIGGMASLTGTGPNLVLKGQSDIVFQNNNATNPITFATWMVFGLPLSLLIVVILWAWMQIFFFRLRGCCSCLTGKKNSTANSRVTAAIAEDYRKLGPITYAEKTIIVLFGLLVLLWISRDLGQIGGWGDLFKSEYVSDSTPALLIALLLFVCPATLPNVFCFRKSHEDFSPNIKTILTWRDVHERMPWSVFLILGAGYCIAEASMDSGLSVWLGDQLQVFSYLDPYLMLLILCYFSEFATEFTSNTAIATLMMPVMAQVSSNLNVNPLFFMYPTALTISCAFMLPVATPPNAIVFSFGNIRVLDMVSFGCLMSLLSPPLVVMATVAWGNAFFKLDTLPPGFTKTITDEILTNVTRV